MELLLTLMSIVVGGIVGLLISRTTAREIANRDNLGLVGPPPNETPAEMNRNARRDFRSMLRFTTGVAIMVMIGGIWIHYNSGSTSGMATAGAITSILSLTFAIILWPAGHLFFHTEMQRQTSA